jgi:hypothetical protein
VAHFDEPVHLPRSPLPPLAYKHLYAFNRGRDDQSSAPRAWRELRITLGLPEIEVYRLLPSAKDFEYSGYLTKTRIRYQAGEATEACAPMARPCTFHSHPTKNPHLADIPSLMDIYSFLNFRHLRSITVGATKIWVFDKTRATLGTVRRLAAWVEANHFRVVARLMKKDFARWQASYVQTAMRELGWISPKTLDDMQEQWPGILRDRLKIKVRVFPRFPKRTRDEQFQEATAAKRLPSQTRWRQSREAHRP